MKFKVKSEDYDKVDNELKSKNQLIPSCEYTRYWIPNDVFIKQMDELGYWYEVIDDNKGEEVFQTMLKEANERSDADTFDTSGITGTFWIRREKQNLDQSVTFNGDGTYSSNLVSKIYKDNETRSAYHFAFEDAYRQYLKVDNVVWYRKNR